MMMLVTSAAELSAEQPTRNIVGSHVHSLIVLCDVATLLSTRELFFTANMMQVMWYEDKSLLRIKMDQLICEVQLPAHVSPQQVSLPS